MDGPAPVDEIVIVSAARLPEAAGERVFSAVTLDAQALEDAARIDEALREIPGASLFRRSGSASANPTVQGLSLRSSAPSGAGRALVTLDGVPQNDPFGGWVIWGALPPETIAGASIVRGAGAGPYGAGALTGVVALEERTQPGWAARVEGGSRGRMRAAGVGIAESGGVDVMLAAAAEHDDGWIPVRDGRGAADTPLWLDALSGSARVQWRGEDVSVSARVSGYAEDRGAGIAGADSSASGGAASLTLVSAPRARGFSWRLQGWARTSDLANRFVAVAADRSTATPANNQLETPAFGWGANAAARWSDAQSGLEVGADVRGVDGETRELFRFMGGALTRSRVAGGESLVVGAYAESWREVGPWLIAGGARVDSWRARDGVRQERDLANGALVLDQASADSDETVPTARVGLRRSFGESFLRMSLSAGFRPPTLNELHRPFRVGNDITEANAALKPERLYGFDLGVGGESDVFSWSVGVFATRLDEPIANVTLGVGPGTFPPNVFVPAGGVFRQRQNAGQIDAAGVEADARGALGNRFLWRAALNYTDARVDGGASAPQLTGLRPAQAPRWSVSAGASVLFGDDTKLSANVFYESERFEDDLNTRRLGDALSADLELAHRLNGPATLFLAVDNAFDAEIATGATADGVLSYAAPRAVRVGLRLTGSAR